MTAQENNKNSSDNVTRQKQCNFRCPNWMRTAIHDAAQELGISDSQYIKTVLSEDLLLNHGISVNTYLNSNNSR